MFYIFVLVDVTSLSSCDKFSEHRSVMQVHGWIIIINHQANAESKNKLKIKLIFCA
jgi:hypothetical protein